MTGWVYMMASKRNGTLYIGVTNDLGRRAYEHRTGLYPGFTRRYAVKQLVWYETYETMPAAIQREKRMKKWPRAWKLEAIESFNPDWDDLYDTLGWSYK